MGTRADFYIGRGEDAEWLGSIAYDGYPEGWGIDLLEHTVGSGEDYRVAVDALLTAVSKSKHGGHQRWPNQGWPWPWEDSGLTDYSYTFDPETSQILYSRFGHEPWWPLEDYDNYPREEEGKRLVFPNMKNRGS